MTAVEHHDTPEPASKWIDLVLGQASEVEATQLRQQVASDPLQALELADTVQMIERLRGAVTDPSPLFVCRMQDVLHQSGRRLARPWRREPPRPSPLRQLAVVLAVAAAVLATLLLLDPAERLRAPESTAQLLPNLTVPVPEPEESKPVVEPPLQRLADAAVGSPDQPMLRASEQALRAERHDALRSWLDPRNLLAVQRLDCELRASAEHRRLALHRRGWLPEVDDRVQALADALVAGLPFRLLDSDTRVFDIAYLVRALLASGTAGPGGRHAADCALAASWLERRLPQMRDGDLAVALLALAERAASTESRDDVVRQGIERLVADSLEPSAWNGNRPELLTARTTTSSLAECGRLLAMAPGFGVDADRARALRALVEAHLQERRLQQPDDPTVLAALAYGCSDLVRDGEAIETKLRAWRPSELVGNLVTLMQLAWSREVGVHGWARFQLDMRRIGSQPTPADFLERSALLLCLATNYAAPGVSGLTDLSD